MKIIVAISMILSAELALAADYQPVHGDYKVGGKTLIDPAESEPQDTHFYLDLDGNAARDLYKAMREKPAAGVCGEPGDLTKRSGGMQCTMEKGGKQYHCAFGVELGTQRIVNGVTC